MWYKRDDEQWLKNVEARLLGSATRKRTQRTSTEIAIFISERLAAELNRPELILTKEQIEKATKK